MTDIERALDIAGCPKWTDEHTQYRLNNERIEFSVRAGIWHVGYTTTAYERVAIIEKHLREWLEKRIGPLWMMRLGGGWAVMRDKEQIAHAETHIDALTQAVVQVNEMEGKQ